METKNGGGSPQSWVTLHPLLHPLLQDVEIKETDLAGVRAVNFSTAVSKARAWFVTYRVPTGSPLANTSVYTHPSIHVHKVDTDMQIQLKVYEYISRCQ